MEIRPEHPAEEIKRLRRCINDLVSVLALPAVWSGGDPTQIVRTVIDVLLGMLRLDLVYVKLKDLTRDTPIEMARVAQSEVLTSSPREITELLCRRLGPDPQKWASKVQNPFGSGDISIVSLQLGLQDEIGSLVVGSRRADFPGETERLLLSVAANQVAMGLQEARLMREQKGVASELDRRVAQRTAELAAANEELRREVAERTLAEEKLRREEGELRRSEARNASILRSALDSIVTIDHEGWITEFNPAAERTFGYRRDEVVGKHLADVLIPPSLREKHRRGFAHFLATGESHLLGRRIEMTAVRADNSQIPVELAVTRVPLDGPPCFTGYLRDITERKRAEETLRRSEASLAEAQRLSLTGSFFKCIEAEEFTWSDQLYRIFEFELGVRVTFELILTRVHPDDISFLHDIRDQARHAVLDFEFEHRLLMPDQTIKYIHVVAHGSRNKGGQIEYVGSMQDVTRSRSSEAALSKARAELAHVARAMSLGALTASIAHEVNQPLSGIITNASTCLRMLAADHPNVDGARETARRTIRDANRASEVITRLRALFGKKDPTAEPVDLNDAVREVVALSLSRFQRDRVLLRTELADDLPLAIGDRVQLQQVIQNLLQNASDAMSNVDDRPRQLLIRTERDDGDRVRLTVRDSGTGFELQSTERLFDAFYSTKSEGMGIGLSVSRSIIESHRGRLWAAPNDDGPGATFSFSIPRLPEGVTSVRSLDAMRTQAGTASRGIRNGETFTRLGRR